MCYAICGPATAWSNNGRPLALGAVGRKMSAQEAEDAR